MYVEIVFLSCRFSHALRVRKWLGDQASGHALRIKRGPTSASSALEQHALRIKRGPALSALDHALRIKKASPLLDELLDNEDNLEAILEQIAEQRELLDAFAKRADAFSRSHLLRT